MPSSAVFPTRAVSITEHKASLPDVQISDDLDATAIAKAWISTLPNVHVNDLTDNAIWRDHFALTGTLRTFFRPSLVSRAWTKLCQEQYPCDFSLIPETARVARYGPAACWLEARFTFRIAGQRPATCSGSIGLVPSSKKESNESDWKIWMLTTILERPDGFPDVDNLRPAQSNDAEATRLTNGEDAISNKEDDNTPSYVDCCVVGAGIGGLTMGGRLHALGLSYVVLEKNASVGDNWTVDRYESVRLHTTKGYNQFPFTPKTFRAEDPNLLRSDDLKAGFQRFVDTFGINVLTSTALESAVFDENADCWTLTLRKKGEACSVQARHVILAVGNNGIKPYIPSYAAQDRYKGDTIHGVQWRNAQPWKGKSGIVIGSANTAHDIISDMAKADFKSITMVQRSPTFLLPMSTFCGLVDPLYNEHIPVDLADRLFLTAPLPVQRLIAMAGIKALAELKPEYFEAFAAQGFRLKTPGDLFADIFDREGGHFFDVGSGELIASGRVKVKSDALPVSYNERGLEFSDGSNLDADVIVFATGYDGHNIRDTAKRVFGNKLGGSLQEFWQCDEEGEMRGAWRYTGHPRIWYTGHGYAHARFYSRFVAMHIKSEVDGKPIEMYMDTPEV